MSRRAIALVAVAAALVSAPVALEAQSPVRFGLAAGATFPIGDAGDSYEWGYHVSGSFTGKPAMSPVGLRGEVMFHQLKGQDVETPAGTFGNDDLNIIAGIINAEIGMSGIGAKPYFLGGIGMYRVTADDRESATKFGFNLGAGVDFGLAGFSAFGEARFHSIMTEGESFNIVPVSFGIRF